MSEIQALLTSNPDDKEPLHKKQPIAVNDDDISKSSDNSIHSRANKRSAFESFWLGRGCVETGAHAREHARAPTDTKVAVEPFPMATEYRIVRTTYQIRSYSSSFGNARIGTKFLSFRARLKHIFLRYAWTNKKNKC